MISDDTVVDERYTAGECRRLLGLLEAKVCRDSSLYTALTDVLIWRSPAPYNIKRYLESIVHPDQMALLYDTDLEDVPLRMFDNPRTLTQTVCSVIIRWRLEIGK